AWARIRRRRSSIRTADRTITRTCFCAGQERWSRSARPIRRTPRWRSPFAPSIRSSKRRPEHHAELRYTDCKLLRCAARSSLQRGGAMRKVIADFIRDDRGVDLIEYALLAGLIAVAAVLSLTSAGTNLSRI